MVFIAKTYQIPSLQTIFKIGLQLYKDSKYEYDPLESLITRKKLNNNKYT